jgi:hypothetical protein
MSKILRPILAAKLNEWCIGMKEGIGSEVTSGARGLKGTSNITVIMLLAT